MKLWPKKEATEQVEQRNYTQLVTADIEAAARGITIPSIFHVAAMVVANAFAVARVEGDNPDVTPDILADVGRDLILQGDSLLLIESGELKPIISYSITPKGSYKVTVAGRKGMNTYPARRIVHVRYMMNKNTLRGISPANMIPTIRDTLINMESSFEQEAGTPNGYLIPIPNDGDDAQLEGLRDTISQLNGRVALVKSTSGGWEQGRDYAPRRDFMAQHLGPQFGEWNLMQYQYANQLVLSTIGIPVELIMGGDGGGQRESWRRFLHGTINPLAMRIVSAFKRVGIDVSINFDDLFASDITGRARAFGSLVQGGMDVAEAASITGIIQEE